MPKHHLIQMLHHIEAQAAAGQKFLPSDNHRPALGNYQLYQNTALLGYETMLMQMGAGRLVFLIHGIPKYIDTVDEFFYGYTFASLHNIVQQSSLICKVGKGVPPLFQRYV